MPRRYFFPIFFAGLILGFAPGVSAQDLPHTSTRAEFIYSDPKAGRDGNLTVHIDSTYAGSTNFVKSKGGVETLANRLRVTGRDWSVSFKHTRFMWHGLADVPITPGDLAPWEGLYDITARYKAFSGVFWDDFHYWITADATSGFEADFPGALGLGMSGELAYDVYEGWMLGIVASTAVLNPLSSDLFGELQLTIALHPSHKHIKKLLELAGYEPSEGDQPVSFHAAFSEVREVYRLAHASNVASNGYAAIQRTTIGAYLDLLFWKHWDVSLGPEYYFYRKYKVYDSKGSQLSSHPLTESLGLRLGVRYEF
jgi:hypothetical protein